MRPSTNGRSVPGRPASRVRRAAVLAAATAFAIALGASGCSSSASPARRPTRPTATGAPPSSASSTTTTTLGPAASDALTQYVLTSAVDAAKTVYAQSYDYTAVSPASLAPLLPHTSFAPIEQASRRVVGVLAQDRNDVLFVMRSGSGRWYCITENTMDGTLYGEGPTRDSVDSNGQCRQAAWPPPGRAANPF